MSVIDLLGELNGLRYGLPTFRRLIPFTVKTQRGANDTIQGDKGYLRPTYGSKGESLVGIELYSSTYASHNVSLLGVYCMLSYECVLHYLLESLMHFILLLL
jgi:hypothetical protein